MVKFYVVSVEFIPFFKLFYYDFLHFIDKMFVFIDKTLILPT